MPSLVIMSCLTTSVTVAVSPKIGVLGNFNFRDDKFSYYARKSFPQVDTQCTSSMMNLFNCCR